MSVTPVRTTYITALSHGVATPAPDDDVFAVVRYPADWLEDVVDRNLQTLAPPEHLLDAYKKIETAAEANGHDEPQRVAWESVEFEDQYLEYLDSAGSQQVLETLRERATEHTIWLVCWEADDTYCHRQLLAERVRDGLDIEPSRGDVREPCANGKHEIVATAQSPHGRECRTCKLSVQTLTDWVDMSGRAGSESEWWSRMTGAATRVLPQYIGRGTRRRGSSLARQRGASSPSSNICTLSVKFLIFLRRVTVSLASESEQGGES